jgi:hypothetical protein
MAERLVRVCDVCGNPAEQSVTFKVGSRSLAQDLCGTHLQELMRRSHAPKRGRRPGGSSAPSPSVAPRPTKATGRRGSKKATTPRPRRRITDPVVLEKRRAALAKARQVRVEKRAAAKAG